MSFTINVDKYGFAEKPNPEKVSRDYAAEAVKKEEEARQAADSTLESLIESEAGARQAADSALQSDINTRATAAQLQSEAAARQESDNQLEAEIAAVKSSLYAETGSRSQNDAALQTNIYHEAEARQAADNSLQEQIDAIPAVEIDTTLTQSGAAADSKTVGDKLAEKLDITVKDYDEIDTITEIGYYKLSHKISTATTDVIGYDYLIVINTDTRSSGLGYLSQILLSNNIKIRFYQVTYGDSGVKYWSEWQTLSTTDSIKKATPYVETEISNTLRLNCIYDLGEQTALSLSLPTAQTGNFIQVDFICGDTPTNLSISTTAAVVSDYDFVPEPNKVYSLFFDYGRLTQNVYGWRFSYAEYTYTEV